MSVLDLIGPDGRIAVPGAAARPAFGRVVARTALCNAVAALAAGVSGALIARALGPAQRGEYAAITAWLLIGFTLGDLGQTAATTFHVARRAHQRQAVLATSRLLTAVSAAVMLAVGLWLTSRPLGEHTGSGVEYRLAVVTCCLMVLGFSCTAALQAVDLARWNVVRTVQPVAYLLVVSALWTAGRLTLGTALLALLVTVLAQTLLAYGFCRGLGLIGGRADPALLRPLGRYGAGELAIAAPGLATTRLDQMFLAGAGNAAGLGHYAVASSLTSLAVPLAAALGHAAFPRLAAADLPRAGTASLRRRSLLAGAGIGVVVTGALAGSAPWLVPAVFGAGFRESVTLIWLLAPTGVLLPAAKVCADLIRGHGRPLAVAYVQAGSAALMAGLLLWLVPALGAPGAAVAAGATALFSLLLMLGTLRRTTRRADDERLHDRTSG